MSSDRKIPKHQAKPPKRLPAQISIEVVEALGGTSALARLCGITASSVSEWKQEGIPRAWALYLRERYSTLPVMKTAQVRDF
jgi:hypothetical protein|uniref:Antitoxin n=1 Tax=Siphoviridae sp. ct16C7 TaxID=2825304 RepID=A0A8S5P033_9CAUD|nr:MAG TPA: antitoxin [Siphoviridae sp. ct16C7]